MCPVCVHSHYVVNGHVGRAKLCERCSFRGLLPDGSSTSDLSHSSTGALPALPPHSDSYFPRLLSPSPSRSSSSSVFTRGLSLLGEHAGCSGASSCVCVALRGVV